MDDLLRVRTKVLSVLARAREAKCVNSRPKASATDCSSNVVES